jgi:signal transduction histidine kinase
MAGFALFLTAAATGLSAAVYGQLRAGFQAQRRALETTEALAGAQLRAQLAENAAAIGKMAAALTHEINTPLGALKSSVDTLLAAAERQASAPAHEQDRFRKLHSDLRHSIELSADRISTVVARLGRFIALEDAELKPANLNELVSDVAVLFEEQMRGRVQLDFDLRPLPPVNCRPQQLTAVFSSLLSNAINAVNGNGHIVISTALADSQVRVKIQDNGRGMSAEELDNIFDPAFRVSESRVASGNWSLFNIRQIVFEHGGDIHIESTEGKGTTVSVTIPR